MRIRTCCVGALSVTTLLAALAACSSGGGTAPPGTTGGTHGTTPAAANVTESNPPGDIPDNQVFVAYHSPQPGYVVRVPEGWARSRSKSSVTFTSNYNTITITTSHPVTAPTPSSVRASEIPAIRAANHNVHNVAASTTHRPAGNVTLITYQADSPPNPVTGRVAVEAVQRYDFYRRGTEVAVTLAAPVGSDNVDPWRIITTSFRWG